MSIQYSNPRPSEHESLPITTRPYSTNWQISSGSDLKQTKNFLESICQGSASRYFELIGHVLYHRPSSSSCTMQGIYLQNLNPQFIQVGKTDPPSAQKLVVILKCALAIIIFVTMIALNIAGLIRQNQIQVRTLSLFLNMIINFSQKPASSFLLSYFG